MIPMQVSLHDIAALSFPLVESIDVYVDLIPLLSDKIYDNRGQQGPDKGK